MLDEIIDHFIRSRRLAQLSNRSIQSLQLRLRQFKRFLIAGKIHSVTQVTHLHLIHFVTDTASESVRKNRIWTMHQFFGFLAQQGYVDKDISFGLKYPKTERTVPQFLTRTELARLMRYFCKKAQDLWGFRDLVIILLLGTLGVRTSTLIALNVEDVDVRCGLLLVKEKGRRKRQVILPGAVCKVIDRYLQLLAVAQGPLLISRRKKRLSPRTLQLLFSEASGRLGIDKRLHARLFRHTAATELNRGSGTTVTQFVLGHSHRGNTLKYAHLNPDKYATYMKRHPFIRKEAPCSP
jgi:site-specific recombinase XerD